MTFRCLILSHGFNMDGRASSQTITDKIPHFIDKGYQLFVLSAITGEKDHRFAHAQLLAFGPSGFRFDFRHWLALRYGRGILYKFITAVVSVVLLPLIFIEKIFIGLSSQWSWGISAAVVGLIWIKTKKINVVYSTGGAWSAHLAGWILKKMTGIKWIVEVHDPLVVRDGRFDDGRSPRASKDARFQQWLEKKICADADLVWWFTEGALNYAKARNPCLGNRGHYFFPGAEPPMTQANYCRGDFFNIAHFGSLANSRSLVPLLEVMPTFFTINPAACGKLKIHVYGSSLDNSSAALIKNYQLQDVVVVHGRLEYDPITRLSGRQRIARYMHEADCLLLLHGDYEGCSEYIPSKLYEYWWAKRPIFAITHLNPQLDHLVAKINGTVAYTAQVNAENSILSALNSLYYDWLSQKSFIQTEPPLGVVSIVESIDKELKCRQ